MPVYSRTYWGSPGAWQVTDPLLANVTILHVARSGVTHVATGNEEASSLQFIYSSFSGTITFDQDIPFADFVPPDGNDINTLEKVFVKWKV